MLTKQETAARLDIHEHTVARWAKHGLIASHAYNGHYYLYEVPDSDLPQKHCSRWDRLVDRAAARLENTSQARPSADDERGVV
jgi:predicted site-specific integrase-resolvase